jgi:uncharacterized protein (TIGR01777 family)
MTTIHERFHGGGGQPSVLISGATGLIGHALTLALEASGRHVIALTRAPYPMARDTVAWDPAAGRIDTRHLNGLEAVVHLAGENVAGGRWNAARKARIRDSREQGTRLLAEALAALDHPPKTLLCASGAGFYGDRGDEEVDEDSPAGQGFLAEVCRVWEGAADPARARGIRVVHARLGVVLAREGGALTQMLPAFRLGLGGPAGSGRQYMSWIALADAVGAMIHILNTPSLAGPVNLVAPQAVRNAEFAHALGRALRRPAILPLPAFAARLALGEMADALLLTGARVRPARLLASGYAFRYPDLNATLAAALGA